MFTEDEFEKFIFLADELEFGESLEGSIKKVWGDQNVQIEKDLNERLDDLQLRSEEYQLKVKQGINELLKRNNDLVQRVSRLEEQLKELREEKVKGFSDYWA